jgi:hypothetical protein
MTDAVPKEEEKKLATNESKDHKNKDGHITAENELRVQAKG